MIKTPYRAWQTERKRKRTGDVVKHTHHRLLTVIIIIIITTIKKHYYWNQQPTVSKWVS